MGKMLVFMGSEIWSMILCPLPHGVGIIMLTKYGCLFYLPYWNLSHTFPLFYSRLHYSCHTVRE